MRTMLAIGVAALMALAAPAGAADVVFEDPAGDDHGPGGYTYPTDAAYTRGSFDLVKFELTTKGKKANLAVTVNANLEDPWGMDVGFATQMVFVFIDTDGKEGSGHTGAPPGLNLQFAPGAAWEKCIVLSPQPFARVKQEVDAKAGELAADIVIPSRVRGSGRAITASVDLSDLGEGDPAPTSPAPSPDTCWRIPRGSSTEPISQASLSSVAEELPSSRSRSTNSLAERGSSRTSSMTRWTPAVTSYLDEASTSTK